MKFRVMEEARDIKARKKDMMAISKYLKDYFTKEGIYEQSIVDNLLAPRKKMFSN